jgi:hypothetical protein
MCQLSSNQRFNRQPQRVIYQEINQGIHLYDYRKHRDCRPC